MIPAALLPGAAGPPVPGRSLLLGVDGGASETVAALLDAGTGRVVTATGRASYLYTGLAPAAEAINRVVEEVLRAANAWVHAVSAAVVGIASVEGAREPSAIELHLPDLARIQRRAIVDDAAVLWGAGMLGQPGVALVAGTGTGSNCVAVDGAGAIRRCGGWGQVLDDEGSNFAVGLAALRAVVRASDGRGPTTALLQPALRHWAARDLDGLAAAVTADPATEHIAALAATVEEVAEAGDRVAAAIFCDAGAALAELVATSATGLHFTGDVPVATGGDALRAGGLLRQSFVMGLARVLPEAVVVDPPLPGVGGALLLAARLCGVEDTVQPSMLAAALRANSR